MATRASVSTSDAPQAIGPYSQAIRAGQFLFLSGQIPLDPVTGEVVAGDVRAQTRRVLDNISGILYRCRRLHGRRRQDHGLPD